MTSTPLFGIGKGIPATAPVTPFPPSASFVVVATLFVAS